MERFKLIRETNVSWANPDTSNVLPWIVSSSAEAKATRR